MRVVAGNHQMFSQRPVGLWRMGNGKLQRNDRQGEVKVELVSAPLQIKIQIRHILDKPVGISERKKGKC